jgi:hypothetical protein
LRRRDLILSKKLLHIVPVGIKPKLLDSKTMAKKTKLSRRLLKTAASAAPLVLLASPVAFALEKKRLLRKVYLKPAAGNQRVHWKHGVSSAQRKLDTDGDGKISTDEVKTAANDAAQHTVDWLSTTRNH